MSPKEELISANEKIYHLWGAVSHTTSHWYEMKIQYRIRVHSKLGNLYAFRETNHSAPVNYLGAPKLFSSSLHTERSLSSNHEENWEDSGMQGEYGAGRHSVLPSMCKRQNWKQNSLVICLFYCYLSQEKHASLQTSLHSLEAPYLYNYFCSTNTNCCGDL